MTTKPTKSTIPKAKSTQPFEFEPALKELDAITTWFESADADLDQGLAKFERGLELAAALKEHLAVVENRIEKIKLKFEAPTVTPTAPATPTEPAPASAASYAAPQDFDRSFSDDEAKSNGEVPGDDYPHVGLFS
jgi:exodeoxyribonuclease VII small subunit